MQEYLEAPVPFIIGVPRKVWESMGYKSYESDLIIYDLDNKYFIKSLSLPILPNGGEKNITECLNMCTKQVMKIASTRYEHTKKLENGLNAIQQIRNIIVAILSNVKNFISSNKKSDTTTVNEIFDFAKYQQSHLNSMFIKEFSKTQQFGNFVMASYYKTNSPGIDYINSIKNSTRKEDVIDKIIYNSQYPIQVSMEDMRNSYYKLIHIDEKHAILDRSKIMPLPFSYSHSNDIPTRQNEDYYNSENYQLDLDTSIECPRNDVYNKIMSNIINRPYSAFKCLSNNVSEKSILLHTNNIKKCNELYPCPFSATKCSTPTKKITIAQCFSNVGNKLKKLNVSKHIILSDSKAKGLNNTDYFSQNVEYRPRIKISKITQLKGDDD